MKDSRDGQKYVKVGKEPRPFGFSSGQLLWIESGSRGFKRLRNAKPEQRDVGGMRASDIKFGFRL